MHRLSTLGFTIWLLAIVGFMASAVHEGNAGRGGKKRKKPRPETPRNASLTYMGMVDTPGEAYQVEASGHIAYVADFDSLQIIDATDPSSPFLLTPYSELQYCFNLAIKDDMLLAVDQNRAHLLDISSNSAPAFVSELPIQGAYIDSPHRPVFLDHPNADLLAVANNVFEFLESPVPVGQISPWVSWGVGIVDGSDLLVTRDYENTGLFRIDISDPTIPRIVSRMKDYYNFNGNYQTIYKSDTSLFLMPRSEPAPSVFAFEMKSFDEVVPRGQYFMIPPDPIICQFSSFPQVEGVGRLLIGAWWPGSIELVSFHDLDHPVLLERVEVSSCIRDLALVNRYLYVSHGPDGISIYRLDLH